MSAPGHLHEFWDDTMTIANSTRPAAYAGALEFEFTDFAEARKVLDEPPAGVESVHTLMPGYWLSRRRKLEPADRALTGNAIDWMMALPLSLRPKQASQRFPRIVNGIAQAWPAPAECVALLDSLLNDGRPGRRGFPVEVRTEFERLRAERSPPSAMAIC